MTAYALLRHWQRKCESPLSGGLCCKTRLLPATELGFGLWRTFWPLSLKESVSALTLREAAGQRWWGTPGELCETAEVLRGNGEQNLVFCAAQTP